ncbi:unnamed protein product, partial [Meganyctiphanes norvegica]
MQIVWKRHTDEHTVFLNNIKGGEGSQYINAARVNSFMKKDALLVMEHPMSHTLSHAWHLVMEKNVAVWVLLHSFAEDNESFPDVLSSNIPEVNITICEVSNSNLFKESQVIMKKEGSPTPYTMSVLEIHGWHSDTCLPSSPDTLLQALDRVNQLTQNPGIALFSCRDGVSGCGVAVSLWLILERYHHLSSIDIYKSVLSVQYDRTQFIQDLEQYNFLYTSVKTYVASF